MSRGFRADPDHGWHHVMNRGVRRTSVFRCDDDRYRFLDACRTAAAEERVDVLAFCLMDNHFHLVLRCPDGGLSATMQRATSRYVRAFNRSHGFDGPLFRSRFHSVPIEDDEQLLTTVRYVHRNPLELGIDIDSYPWSSHRAYLDGRHSWVRVRPVLEMLGGSPDYARFVEQAVPSDEFHVSDGVRSVAARPDDRPTLARLRAIVGAVGAGSSKSDQRSAALVLALDGGLGDAATLARELGFVSAGAARTAASRARVRIGTDARFRQLVEAIDRALPVARPAA